ncbi:hypothetical protein BOX15_Mlig029389g2 [Macrostomum lignano]|uniref:5'-AMP-activated protein kinase subunit beta-1 n=1 Tax=Macrostomum lignano TaxID=282301 RepID=A0A267FZG9_9PLAT|nr:hypothetical protein BOX15_Mlig029389g2 [Macrostomum lignano]
MGNTPGSDSGRSRRPSSGLAENAGYQPPLKKKPHEDSQDGQSDGPTDLSAIIKNVSEEEHFRLRAATLSEKPGDHVTASKLPTVFKWEGGGKQVFLTGSFNSWQTKIPLVKSRDNFYTIVELPQGVHEYKFIVDDAWKHDGKQPTVPNNMGSVNNRIEVKASDFEVFEALAMDIAESNQPKDTTTQSEVSERTRHRSGSPPGRYTNTVPQPRGSGPGRNPPALPQQLLQVILNKPTDAKYDPNLLPEPDHVMLNHLYALSIKDGVIVLSTIHRYRKKFVTTVMYKPCD